MYNTCTWLFKKVRNLINNNDKTNVKNMILFSKMLIFNDLSLCQKKFITFEIMSVDKCQRTLR